MKNTIIASVAIILVMEFVYDKRSYFPILYTQSAINIYIHIYICRVLLFNIPWYEPKHSFKSEFRILISYSDVAIENKDTVEVALCGQCHVKQNEMNKIYVKSILFIWVHEKIVKLC